MFSSFSDESTGARAEVDGTASSLLESLDTSFSEPSGRLKNPSKASSAVRLRFPTRTKAYIMNEYLALEHERRSDGKLLKPKPNQFARTDRLSKAISFTQQ